MPNQNPAGINQPLDKHPTWMTAHKVIGADGAIFADVDPTAGDLLVVPPPSAGGVRTFSGINDLPGLIIDNVSGATLTVYQLVYKDAAGNEVIIVDEVNILNNAFAPVQGNAMFALIPEDQGLFLRLTGGAATGVSVTVNWQDVDNVEVFDAVLAGPTKVSLFPAASPGEALMILNNLPTSPLAAWILNKDSVAHDVSNVTVTQDEGAVSVPFRVGSWGGAVAGTGDSVFDDSKPIATPEIAINISDATAVSTVAPVVRIAFTRLNQGPVAQENSGAF